MWIFIGFIVMSIMLIIQGLAIFSILISLHRDVEGLQKRVENSEHDLHSIEVDLSRDTQ